MADFLSFDSNTQEVNEFKYITVNSKDDAVQENIFLEDLKVETWEGKEDVYLEVTVKNAKDQTANRRYNEPKLDGTYNKTEDDLKKANDKMLKVSKNIATKVLGDSAKIGGANWKELWTNMVNAIKAKPNWNKVPMRVLFVHDNNGYTKLRSFSPIFELMSVPKEKSSLTPGNYDKYVAKQAPSTESNSTSATAGVAAEEIF